MLLERAEEILCLAGREAAALVFDLDEHARRRRRQSERDFSAVVREFEGVVKQVRDGGGEALAIRLDDDVVVDGGHGETHAARLRDEKSSRLDLFEELPNSHALDVLHPVVEPHVGE